MSLPKTFLVLGAGSRGSIYGQYALAFPEKAKFIGVAEPRKYFREKMASDHQIEPDLTFECWSEAAEKERFADAVIIATQDTMHLDPVKAFAAKGYHILLEKPMAPDLESCEDIVRTVRDRGILFSVCHVLRYTDYTRMLKALIDSGAVGEIVSIQHLEPVGFWHQAHSFVRGNWRNEEESSFMLLAKSCHDMDWISYISGKKCTSVSSFGSLFHFRKQNQPDGAADRCSDCPSRIESHCPYSAMRIYHGFYEQGMRGWPLDVIADNVETDSIEDALLKGPYGRCVYACDNDVVDNQVVNLQFEDGSTAGFTMTAFNKADHRKTRIFGTKGEISGDGVFLEYYDFLEQKTRKIDTRVPDVKIMRGHGGGDFGIMDNFVSALIANDPSLIISGADETIESHRIVFRAEESRKTGMTKKM